jgi:hypothetical protein
VLTTHNFTTDERHVLPSAEQDRKDELAAWIVVVLMFVAVGAGVVIDRTVSFAVMQVAENGSLSPAPAHPNGYRRWRNDVLAERIARRPPPDGPQGAASEP